MMNTETVQNTVKADVASEKKKAAAKARVRKAMATAKVTQSGRELCSLLDSYFNTSIDVREASYLSRLAQKIHTQSENSCSYEWAQEPRYQRLVEATDKRAELVADIMREEFGLFMSTQGDCRGCAVRISQNPQFDGCPVNSSGEVAICR